MGGGVWDQGLQVGGMVEADLTLQLAQACEDELQRAGARHKILRETRHGEGLDLGSRLAACPTNGTLVSLHFDSLSKPGYNGGRVYAGPHPAALELAERLAAVILAWGAMTSNRYRECKASVGSHPQLQRDDAICLLVSPFSLSAPDALVYARRLQTLGMILGSALASWGIGRNPAIRCYQPLTAQRDVAQGPAAKGFGELFRGRGESPRTNDTARQIWTRSPAEPTE